MSDQPVAQAATCTTYNKHNRRTTMPLAGFKPAIPGTWRPLTCPLDRTAADIGPKFTCLTVFFPKKQKPEEFLAHTTVLILSEERLRRFRCYRVFLRHVLCSHSSRLRSKAVKVTYTLLRKVARQRRCLT